MVGRPPGAISRPRDARGWLVPTPGTRSRMIYECLRFNLKTYQIARILGMSKLNVWNVIYRIRNPEQFRIRNREYMASRRGSQNVSP